MDGTFDKLAAALKNGGMVAALKVLNEHVPQRYSALYWLAPDGRLVNIALVDKLDEPCPGYLASVPYEDTFCQFTIKHGQFRTSNSAVDERLQGNPYQGVINSYHSVPVISTTGQVLGTICHFDPAASSLPDEEFELLRLAARAFPEYLHRFERTIGDTGLGDL